MTTHDDDCPRVLSSAVVSTRTGLGLVSTIAIIAITASSCSANLETSLERWSEARRLSSDLLVSFTNAADAGNRAVMADTDETSIASAREAEESMKAVQKNVEALAPSDEPRLLE